MPRDTNWTLVIVCSLLLLICIGFQYHLEAVSSSPTTWVNRQFFTVTDLTAFLNTLPDDKARDAKILVINSQRSFLGVASSPYFLIYRK